MFIKKWSEMTYAEREYWISHNSPEAYSRGYAGIREVDDFLTEIFSKRSLWERIVCAFKRLFSKF